MRNYGNLSVKILSLGKPYEKIVDELRQKEMNKFNSL